MIYGNRKIICLTCNISRNWKAGNSNRTSATIDAVLSCTFLIPDVPIITSKVAEQRRIRIFFIKEARF